MTWADWVCVCIKRIGACSFHDIAHWFCVCSSILTLCLRASHQPRSVTNEMWYERVSECAVAVFFRSFYSIDDRLFLSNQVGVTSQLYTNSICSFFCMISFTIQRGPSSAYTHFYSVEFDQERQNLIQKHTFDMEHTPRITFSTSNVTDLFIYAQTKALRINFAFFVLLHYKCMLWIDTFTDIWMIFWSLYIDEFIIDWICAKLNEAIFFWFFKSNLFQLYIEKCSVF